MFLTGIVAVVASPALAAKRQHVTHFGQSETSKVIPGYTKNGATVAIPDPDSSLIASRLRQKLFSETKAAAALTS